MEVPRLGVELEWQPLAYTTATPMPDQSCTCDLHHSSWPCWILNPLNEARDRTCLLMVTSQICFHCATMETPGFVFFFFLSFIEVWLIYKAVIISAVQQQSDSSYKYACPFSQIFFPHRRSQTQNNWVEFPVLYSRSPLAKRSIHLRVHMPVPNPLHPATCPLW